MLIIDTIDANDMLLEAQLDDTVYHIGLSWNQEAGQWTLSIRDLNQSILASGISVVPNWPLLSQARRPDFPSGEILAMKSDHLPIARNSFASGNAYLAYVSLDDIANA